MCVPAGALAHLDEVAAETTARFHHGGHCPAPTNEFVGVAQNCLSRLEPDYAIVRFNILEDNPSTRRPLAMQFGLTKRTPHSIDHGFAEGIVDTTPIINSIRILLN